MSKGVLMDYIIYMYLVYTNRSLVRNEAVILPINMLKIKNTMKCFTLGFFFNGQLTLTGFICFVVVV